MYNHIPFFPFLDSEIVNKRHSHVWVSFEAECEDGDTNEKHRHNSDSLQTHFIFQSIHIVGKSAFFLSLLDP